MDKFINAELESKGIEPTDSPKRELIRQAFLDPIGLPLHWRKLRRSVKDLMAVLTTIPKASHTELRKVVRSPAVMERQMNWP